MRGLGCTTKDTILAAAIAALVVSPARGARATPRASSEARDPVPGPGATLLPVHELFDPTGGRNERAIIASRPRAYRLGPTLAGPALLVLGLPGRATAAESFGQFLSRGLIHARVGRELVVATIHDPRTGGPVRQGAASPRRANSWRLDRWTIDVLGLFVSRLLRATGCDALLVVGYSSGGAAAPLLAARLAGRGIRVVGAVSIAEGTAAGALELRQARVRVLFLAAPPQRPTDRGVQPDLSSRERAERSYRRLLDGGVDAELRHIDSARRHLRWHWGLISPCRFVAPGRSATPAGSWPDYWRPNPETISSIGAFIGQRSRRPASGDPCAP